MTMDPRDKDSYIADIISGYYRLLAAIVDLAEHDAKLEPEKYKNPDQRADARRAKEGAVWFLADVEEYRRTLSAS
jgi:hypothetical protein